MNKLFTLMTCNYNTPKHILTMLRSFVKTNGDGPWNLVLFDNSTDEISSGLLNENEIFHYRTPGQTHSPTIDKLLLNCKTKYALLVDSDIIFRQKIDKLIDVMEKTGAAILGQTCGDRGGYRLNKRVHPWFCLINVEKVKQHKISWHDQKRIDDTNSGYFYKNVPICPFVGNITPFYDNGATFYEDVCKAGLRIVEAIGIEKYYTHYEGSSWQRNSGHSGFENLGNSVYEMFLKEYEFYKDVDIKGKFVTKIDEKIAVIQPIFCPDQKHLEINIKSTKSLLDYFEKTGYTEANFYFYGYCKEAEFKRKFIIEFNNSRNVNIKFLPRNYGKAYVVNKIFNECIKDEKYFLTMDSDMIWEPSSYDQIRRLVSIANLIPEKLKTKRLGMVSLNQTGQNCHLLDMMDRGIEINGEPICWSSTYSGVAGGCLLIDSESFREIGGYRVMGTYSGDDGYLLYDMNSKNYPVVIAKNISVFHPSDESFGGKYQAWKHNVLDKCRNENGRKLSEHEFNKIVDETERAWENKFNV